MKFIIINHGAAEELASDRVLQSPAFDQANALAQLLRTRTLTTFSPRVSCSADDDGIYILKDNHPSTDHYLVFDLRQADVFAPFEPADIITVFQKTLRFALRIWNNQKLSPSEHPLPGSNTAIIFPFPISSQRSFRVGIDRRPDAERATRRGAGNHLLVFFCADSDTTAGTPTLATFRQAIEGAKHVRRNILPQAPSSTLTPVNVTTLEEGPKGVSVHMGFDYWTTHLTKDQRLFVERPLNGAERIEGPAGTGKTLCLVLRVIHMLREAARFGQECHLAFVAHSEATKTAIHEMFVTNDTDRYYERERLSSSQSLTLTTLQAWCASQLGKQFSETEYLDRDALEAKQLRLLYVEESVSEALSTDLLSHKPFLSAEFLEFLAGEDSWLIAEMMQHEIGVMIKGRAKEDLDTYKSLPGISYNLPLKNASDRGFVYIVFQRYQAKLKHTAQFDTDDIVLTAIGQLDTPIWRRRRGREAYDAVFIDETHLFNLNELSAFHLMTKDEHSHRIVFSADKTQAPGDRGLTSAILDSTILDGSAEHARETKVNSMFRCSGDITNLALSVTAAGATLFTNFENPLNLTESITTHADELKASKPTYVNCVNDAAMIDHALERAQRIADELDCNRSDILIIAFSADLLRDLEKRATELNKPVEVVKRRGDLDVVHKARKHGRFVLSTPDFVGGLEFDGVLLVGVDDGRVPPATAAALSESKLFLNFSWHNRLYVAITRARHRVEILGVRDRGPSHILSSAISGERLVVQTL